MYAARVLGLCVVTLWSVPGTGAALQHASVSESASSPDIYTRSPAAYSPVAPARTAAGAIADRGLPAPSTISSVAITSTPSFDADGDGTAETYLLGEHIDVTVTWSADVAWDVSAEGAALRLRLDVDGHSNTTRQAGLVTGGATSGTARSLVFRYTVAPRDRDTDGVYPKPSGTGNLVHLISGATLEDAQGQDAARAHGGLSADPNHQVDGREDRTAAAVTIADASAEEGDDITFTVTLDKAVAGGFTVTPSFVDGTATEGTDYTANTAGISFAGTAGETQTFTVATIEDTDEEDDETFRVRLSVSGTSETVTATSRATGTIRNDDVTPPPPTISAVAITSTPSFDADGDGTAETYLRGEHIEVTVTWSADVVWDVSAAGAELRLRLDVDGQSNTTKLAGLVTGGGTSGTARSLVFRYAVAPRDRDTDGVYPKPSGTGNLVHLISGATLKDAHDQDPSRAHRGLSADRRHQVDGRPPAVTIGDASADEGDDITFTATLDKPVAGGFTVTPSFTDGTATEGTDYTANTAAISFAGTAGETQTFTVATTEDSDVEDDETFTVGLSVSGTSASVTATSTATGTIRNDDETPAVVTIADASAEEGDDITFTVTVDRAVAGGFTVTPSFTDGTATEGTDYTASTAAISFAGTAGETQTFTVATTEDSDVEDDETFTVGLSVSGTSANVTATSTATGTIRNDDETPAPPTISSVAITSTPSFDVDGDGTAETYLLGEHIDVTVTWSADVVWDVSAEGAELRLRLDVDGQSNTTKLAGLVTDGATSGTARSLVFRYTVAPRDRDTDGVYPKPSGTGNLVHLISGATLQDAHGQDPSRVHAGLSADPRHQVDGREDRTAAAVTISDASAEEGDDITFTVTLDKAVAGGFTVTPSFVDETATEGTDYTANTEAIDFAGDAGETQTFTVATIEDSDEEDDETFRVRLRVSGASETVTATSRATGTIRNDDVTPPPPTISSVAITSTPSFDADGDGTAETYLLGEHIDVTVTWSADVVWDVSAEGAELRLRLDVDGRSNTTRLAALVTGGAASGTARSLVFRYAVEPRDRDTDGVYPKPSGTGNLVQLISGATLKDAHDQDASRTHGGLSADPRHQVDGREDRTAAAVTISDASAEEGDDITFTVTLDKAVAGGFTVTPSFVDQTATEGTDYTANTEAIDFAGDAGETQTFTVATIEDSDEEDDETFRVRLRVSGASETVTATSRATGTIRNDDVTPPPPTISAVAITSTPSFDADGDGTAETYLHRENIDVTVTWSADVVWDVSAPGAELRLRLDIDGESNATRLARLVTDGATSGTARSLVFRYAVRPRDRDTDGVFPTPTADGNLVQLISGATLKDTHGQDASRAHRGLSADPRHQVDGGGDGRPAAVTIADAWAHEGDTISFTVTLDKAVAGGFSVTPSFTDSTATEGTDYTGNPAAIDFAGTAGETQTFTVATTEDSAGEDDETFTVGLTVSGTSETVTATSTATGTIRDDDTPSTGVTLSVSPFWVAEDGADTTLTVIAALDADAFDTDVPVTVSVGDTADSATEGTDYQTVDDFVITIAAGNTADTATFTLSPTNDDLKEGEETISVSGSATDLEVTGAEVFIVDDEGGGVIGTSTAPTFGDATVANQSYELNKAITPLVLPAATGGVGTLTYALSPSLPAGLTFTASTRTLAGTPTAGQTATRYTYTATGSDAAADSIEFTIGVTFGCAKSPAVGLFQGPHPTHDCEALLASEATLVGTGTALNWDTNRFIYFWEGVSLIYASVSALELYNASLAGSIPAELGNVDWLETLLLHGNSLTGSIPAELGNLSWLQTLSLHSNSLTGSIPAELGNLSNLTSLDLSNNSLTGSIPAELGDLSRLTVLSLHNNELTGSIPAELGELSHLNFLNVSNNRLTGCIPVSLRRFAGAINPQKSSVSLPVCLGVPVLTLAVGDGQIAAAWTVPVGGTPTGYDVEYKLASDAAWTNAGHTGTDTTATIGSLTNRSAYHVRVRAKTTTDTGDWSAVATATPSANPPDFGTATVANQMYTPNTEITDLVLPAATGGEGTVTYALSPDPPAGLSFDAGTRTLSGTPTRGGSAAYAYTATDADNNVATLTFTIAVTFGCSGSTAVGGSSVTSGGLVDDCEALLASAPGLIYGRSGHDLPINWDTGTAMADWVGVTLAGGRVTGLFVWGGGPIPAELGDLSSLTQLRLLPLGGFTGPVPSELGKLSNLTSLRLSGNELTSIPPELGNLSNLTSLDLSLNSLTGPIPPWLGQMSNLKYLGLSGNALTGTIPPELGQMSTLISLGLSDNRLMGSIPSELGDLSDLTSLGLANSGLTGSIPPELGNLSNLTGLNLSNNSLTGSIPPELGNLSRVYAFDLSDNALTGSIPPELGNLSRDRDLSSPITYTQVRFDIAGNQLTGTIPPELGSIAGFLRLNSASLSIGTNWLKGCVPTAFQGVHSPQSNRQRDRTTLPLCGVVLSVNPASVAENAAATLVTVTGTMADGRASDAARAVTVEVGKSSDVATEGTDYAGVAAFTLTIPADSKSGTATFTLTPTDDSVEEGDETLSVIGVIRGLAVSDTAVTIIDDEGPPSVSLVLSADSISESGESSTVTATLSKAWHEAVTVEVAATAVSPAVAGDFTLSANDTLTIAAGETTSTGTVTITAVNNAVDAPDKEVTVSATATGGGVANPSDQDLTITDDDATPTVTLVLSADRIPENGGSATVTATLSGASSEAVRVTVSAAAVSPAVAADFTLSGNKTLTIAAGETASTGTVTVSAVNNAVDAPDKAVTVSATVLGGREASAPASKTLTIVNDDATTVNLVLSPMLISENGDSTTVTATLSGPSSEDVTLVVSATAVSPAVASDFTLSANDTLTIAAGATTSTGTVRIKAVNNLVDAPDKSVTVSATASGGNGVSAPANLTLTITDDDATPTATLVLSPDSISENGDSTTVTATLSGPSTENVTLVVSAAAVSPAVAEDFTLSANDTLTIAAGATTSTGTVKVKAVDNAVDAPDKSVTVSARASGGNGVADPSDQTLTITDDDATPTVTLVLSADSISENGDSTTVTATLSGVSSEKVTLLVAATAVSPAVAEDFTLSANDTLTIAAGATTSTRTVRIKAVNNAVDAPDKSVTVSATASGGNGVADPSDQTLTITDDDATPTVSLVLSPDSISEDGDSTTVTATLSAPSSEKVTLVVSAVAVSPAVAEDFTLSANDTLTIAAGATTSTRTVRIKAVNNAVDAPDKSVTVSATATGGRGVVAPADQTLTITDDDATPTVTLVLSPDSIGENGDSTTVTATLSGPSSESVTLVVSAEAVSPAVAADFTLSTNDTLTIAAGATTSTRTVRIKAVNNAVDAPDKSVTVSATAAGGRGVSAPSNQTLTITDDDATPTVTLVLSPASIGENGDSTTVTATLSGPSSESVTLVVSAAAVSPAVASDFTLSANDTLTIAAGATTSTRTVRIKAVNNPVDAPDKSVTVSATATGGNRVSAPANQTLTISDDDATPTVTLVLNPASIGENGDSTTVTATLSGVSSEKVTLVVSATAVSPAVASDFTLSANDTLTIAAGATTSTRTVKIKAVNNAVDAPDKSVTVSATASGGNGVAAPSNQTLTITDDDATPTVTLVLSSSSISENGDSTTVTATLSGPSSEKVTLVVSAAAVSPAVASDFTLSTNDTLTIAAGATTSTRTVRIKAVSNAVDAPDKSVTVSATVTGGNGVSAPSNQTLTITDDDATPTVNLVLSPSSISENGDSTTVTATLSGPSSEKVTLVVSATAVSPAVASDFTLSANDTLTIAAGATTSTRTVRIKAVNNAVDAPDKSVTVSATVTGGNGVSAPSNQTLTITDDDATPTVSLVLSPSSISENGDSTTVTATLSGPSSEKVTLVVSATAVSPAVASDFTLSANDTLTIAAGATTSTRTVRIKAVNNAVDAPDKSVTVSATATGGRGVSAPSNQTLTITDDDATPTVTLVLSPSSISENGDSTTVTATLSGPSSEKVTLVVSAAAVSPAAASDFTLSANDTLTIAAGATTSTRTVRIKAVNNAIDAPDKSVTVSATATGGRGVSAPSNQTLTITDDDATPTVTLVLSPSSISENGDSTTVTATLSGPSSEKVTLVVSAAAVSPAAASDFTLSANDTLTIAAGATTSTRTVRIKAVNNARRRPGQVGDRVGDRVGRQRGVRAVQPDPDDHR